ncbi:periplasmic-binding protein domain protein [Bordetella bronchiseptica 99-R-0433]|uniref:ABC transporter substrate-binding protein n=1 Tax=Bordetella bronchiseptica TaxID=518 RepID=UPI00045B87C9|nr:ABC transporter substrate-binding protein [Bordetella bronchiseptica]KCV62062.1 periplasmic-binding protein domain protein [Bordetella bronchiseptica 99-R-0433]
MKQLKHALAAASLSAFAVAAGSAQAQESRTLILGVSAPMSGAAATWGLGQEWTAKQAAREINDAGGVKIGGTTYKFEVRAYDNKYNAAEGTKVAQNIVNRDKSRYVVGSIGTAPILALQSLTERNHVILFTSAWGKTVKGPQKPYTLTQSNTPFEILAPLYDYVKARHPAIKTVAMLNPNDATGKETEPVAQKAWEKLGVKVVSINWYERGTTQFQPIAQKLAAVKPDVVDLGVTPPADAGVVFRELSVLGWDGVKVQPVGTGAAQLVEIGGKAADGVYMGFSGDYEGAQATAKQRELNEGMKKAIGESLNPLQLAPYDSVYALKAGMEAANSIEPADIVKALPTIVFETSYGKTAFGGAQTYGSPQQMLIPIMITQIQDGKLVEVERVVPQELQQRLAKSN